MSKNSPASARLLFHYYKSGSCHSLFVESNFAKIDRRKILVTAEKINLLLEPFLGSDSLSPAQVHQVQIYIDLLLKWNTKINLTAIRSEEEVVTRHFGESFFVARHLAKASPRLVSSGTSAVDIGSGAGFPGLPIKIWSPELDLTLVESNQKKAAFLREAIRALGLKKVEVLAIRAQDLRSKFGLVTFRAVENFEGILPVAASLLSDPAAMAVLIGESQVAGARRLLPSLAWRGPISIPSSRQRVLLIGKN